MGWQETDHREQHAGQEGGGHAGQEGGGQHAGQEVGQQAGKGTTHNVQMGQAGCHRACKWGRQGATERATLCLVSSPYQRR